MSADAIDSILNLEKGDITIHAADALVNAANSGLLGGGGVDGAIHRAGGPKILEECQKIRQVQGKCPPGQAVITSAGELPARFIIHTVGPIWKGGALGEPKILASCYSESLKLATRSGAKTIAFPSVSTGVYGYPVELAAVVAIDTARNYLVAHPSTISRITWVLFDDVTFHAYKRALADRNH